MFSDNTPVTDQQSSSTSKKMATQAAQREEIVMAAAIHTEISIEVHETCEYYVSRVDPTKCSQEEIEQNIEPSIMTKTQTQLEASHSLITEGIIATIDQGTNTELEEHTHSYSAKTPKSTRGTIHRRRHQKG